MKFIAVVLAAGLAACSTATPTPEAETVTVFAASSLKPTFTELGTRFEKAHPNTHLSFSFGGSSDLAAQIEAGAPADVFASADDATMAKVGTHVRTPHHFASNTLTIAVPQGNPAHVAGLADLNRVETVVCAPQVPCGAAAATVAHHAGITLRPVSEEQSVTDVLGKIEAGEADAGLVYVTDVKAAGGRVVGIPVAGAGNVVNHYPIAAVRQASPTARAFVTFVRGRTGQAVLKRAGFGPA